MTVGHMPDPTFTCTSAVQCNKYQKIIGQLLLQISTGFDTV